MQWIESHNMEYGECTVLGAKSEVFFVDCGSNNRKLHRHGQSISSVVRDLTARYADYPKKRFLLTHFHRDHMNGFMQIFRKNPNFFDQIYIPKIPCNQNGSPALLDFAIFAYAFLPSTLRYTQVNTSCIRLLCDLVAKITPDRICMLEADDIFSFDNETYEILWPNSDCFSYEASFTEILDELNSPLIENLHNQTVIRFCRIKEQILDLYLDLSYAFSSSMHQTDALCDSLVQQMRALLFDLQDTKRTIRRTDLAISLSAILQDQSTVRAYSDAVNKSSVVFHNLRTSGQSNADILMTGDATPSVFDAIADNLYPEYYLVKAPHHGTTSSFTVHLETLSPSHLLISNGEYHAGGAIDRRYIDLMPDTIKHCTNSSACPYFLESAQSCNRLSLCYEQKHEGSLILMCKENKHDNPQPPCRIATVHAGQRCACLCDS